MRKKGVLLGFVEPVDLIHEQNRPTVVALLLKTGLLNYLLDILDSRQDSTDCHEVGVCFLCNDLGQRGFSDSGRPPKDHGWDLVGFNALSKKASLAQEVFLAHNIPQAARSYPIRKRAVLR